MWWDRSELADVYLSPTCIGLVTRRSEVVTWFQTQDLDDGLARCRSAMSQAPLASCGRVRVWLSSALARPLMLSATSGAHNREEAKGLATMLAPDATGIDEPVRTWTAAWRTNRGGLAVVLPESAWGAVNQIIDSVCEDRFQTRHENAAGALKLVSVRPWWNQVLNAILEESARDASRIGWSLREGDGVVHGVVEKGHPVEAGFDLLGAHDTDGSLLRRRLEVNWNAGGRSRHLEFTQEGVGTPAEIGAWREPSGREG